MFLVVSSFPKLVHFQKWDVLLFQTTKTSWHGNLHGAIAAVQTVSSHVSSTVSCKKLEIRWVIACCGGMEELHAREALISCADQGGAFLCGDSRACTAGKMKTFYLKNEFRSSACCFFEELLSIVLSTLLQAPNWVGASVDFVLR